VCRLLREQDERCFWYDEKTSWNNVNHDLNETTPDLQAMMDTGLL
jgi:hypothetical protein